MSKILIGVICIALMFIFLCLKMWVGLAMSLAGFIGMIMMMGFDKSFRMLFSTSFNNIASYTLTVMPMFVPHENLMSRVDGVFNCVEVVGDAIDRAYFTGRGAGKFPTASAVLGDMIEEVQLENTIPSQTWENVNSTDFIEDFSVFSAKRYFRTTTADISALSEVFGELDERTVSTEEETVFITANALNATEVDNAVKALAQNGINVLAEYPVLVS